MAYDEYGQAHQGNILDDMMLVKARHGIEAERFFHSNVGRLIVAKAEEEIGKAYKALSLVDPDNASQVRAYQFDIAVARAVPEWLAVIIQEGEVAARTIREEEDELGG